MIAIHVYPKDDLVAHVVADLEGKCPCCPEVEETLEGRIIMHTAWDGREDFETMAEC